MKKEKTEELLYMYVLNELSDTEKAGVEKLIDEDNSVKEEYEKIKKLYAALTETRPSPANERELVSARGALMRMIRNLPEDVSLMHKLVTLFKNVFTKNYKAAFGGAALVVLALSIGYLYYTVIGNQNPVPNSSHSINVDNVNSNQISSIKFPNPFSDNGDIEINLGGPQAISYKGKFSDPAIQNILAKTIESQTNTGARIKTVSAIASEAENNKFIPDPRIKYALISALKTDENPGVRREALNALTKFSFDQDIRDALLYVLSRDKNSGMRVAAINVLADIKVQGNTLDEKIRNVLNKKSEHDENGFVKIRAASLLKENN